MRAHGTHLNATSRREPGAAVDTPTSSCSSPPSNPRGDSVSVPSGAADDAEAGSNALARRATATATAPARSTRSTRSMTSCSAWGPRASFDCPRLGAASEEDLFLSKPHRDCSILALRTHVMRCEAPRGDAAAAMPRNSTRFSRCALCVLQPRAAAGSNQAFCIAKGAVQLLLIMQPALDRKRLLKIAHGALHALKAQLVRTTSSAPRTVLGPHHCMPGGVARRKLLQLAAASCAQS